jgi:phosphoribosylformylglycinamidine synthase
VGLIEDVAQAIDLRLKQAGDTLILIGRTLGWLGASLFLREIAGREDGAPPPVDLAAERCNGDFVREQILAGAVSACHDLSDGGLAVALAEMAMAGGLGAAIDALPEGVPLHAAWFGEDQGRYLLSVAEPERLLDAANAAGIPALRLGTVGGETLAGPGLDAVSVAEVTRLNRGWLPAYMAGEL